MQLGKSMSFAVFTVEVGMSWADFCDTLHLNMQRRCAIGKVRLKCE